MPDFVSHTYGIMPLEGLLAPEPVALRAFPVRQLWESLRRPRVQEYATVV